MKKNACVVFFVFLLTMALAGCGKSEVPLRVGVGADPESLDPRKLSTKYDALIAKQLYEGLTYLNEKGEVQPAAAEKWDISADGCEFTFHLRKDAQWSDGTPVTAQDFEYTWKSHLDPKLASITSDQLYFIKKAEACNKGECSAAEVGVTAKDDYTLVVTLEHSTPFFAELMSLAAYMPIQKAAAVKDAALFNDVTKIPCNGAYKVSAWQKNSKVVLQANEHYWGKDKVKEKIAEFIISDSAATQLAMFQSDALDLMFDPPASEVERLKAQGVLKINPSLGTNFFSFNDQQPPFDNPKVRQAFCLALNRQMIVDKVLKGGQKPAMALVAPGIADAESGKDFRTVGGDYFKDNDVENAKKMIAEAGYPGGKGFPKVSLLYDTGDMNKQMAEAAQEMWKNALGIRVELKSMEKKVFLATRRKFDFMIARDGWGADYGDPFTYLSLFSKDYGNTKANYYNQHFDSVLAASCNVADKAVRFRMLHECEDLLMQSYAIIPVYYYSDCICVSKRMKPFEYNALGDIYLKFLQLK